MNAIVQISQLSELTEPQMSGDLAYLVANRLDRDPISGSIRPVPTAAARAEARGLLGLFAPLMAPVSREVLRDWLLPLTLAVRNPPSPDGLDARLLAIGTACDDLPAAAFSARTSKLAVQKFLFWPAAADIYEFLRADCAGMLDRVNAVQDIAFAPTQDAVAKSEDPPTIEEDRTASVAEVARKLGAFRSEIAEPSESPRYAGRPIVKQHHLSTPMLSEIYKAEGLKNPRASQ